jgi:hypothetical protein
MPQREKEARMRKVRTKKSPMLAENQLRGDKEESPCRESITTRMKGEHEYKIVDSDEDCPAPTPDDMAEADANARDNLLKYGTRWCAKGNESCSNRQCVPSLSDIQNQGYTTESRPKTDRKKGCYVIATISGKVSCHCKN